jgi:hypothetical protein
VRGDHLVGLGRPARVEAFVRERHPGGQAEQSYCSGGDSRYT